MKRVLTMILAMCMLLGLAACGGSTAGSEDVVVNFRAHPHLEGKSLNLCSQTPGAIR